MSVYPRVGGGTASLTRRTRSTYGLSPRGRGNRGMEMADTTQKRSIPAWAGEPVQQALSEGSTGVYPRVGGGTRGRPGP